MKTSKYSDSQISNILKQAQAGTPVPNLCRELVGVQPFAAVLLWGGISKQIRSDNGPEYISGLLSAWCEQNRMTHQFTQPGNPQQNTYVERFNLTMRQECLNQHVFEDIEQVQLYTTEWQWFYNNRRPNMAADGKPPAWKMAS